MSMHACHAFTGFLRIVDTIWKHSNQMIYTAFSANEFTLVRRSNHTRSLLWKHRQRFQEPRGIYKMTVFFKMDLRNTTLLPCDQLWCRRSVLYYLYILYYQFHVMTKIKKSTDMLTTSATLIYYLSFKTSALWYIS